MQSFCKTLYKHIMAAGAGMEEHARFKLANPSRDETRVQLYDLPDILIDEIMTRTATVNMHFPTAIIQSDKINTTCNRVTRIIPESTTRIDVFFLTGPHCYRDVNHRRIADIIELYVRVLERMAPIKHQTVQIALLPTAFKKQMSIEDGAPLRPNQLQSGVTVTPAFGTPVIFVYRYEEMFKVLLHELLHMYRFDYYETRELALKYNRSFERAYKVNSKRLALNEAYNDALAVTMYAGFFIAVKQPHLMREFADFYASYRNHFKSVRSYIIKMSAKLSLYSERHFNGVTHEETHAFAYYHGKAALLANSREFFTFMKRNDFHIAPKAVPQYIRLLKQSLNSKEYKDKTRMYKQQLTIQLADPSSASDFFFRTLRMCNLDLAEKIDN